MTSFKNTIQQHFRYLFEEWGFEFQDVVNDYQGNIVIAQSDKLKIRFINDRADFFLDIGGITEMNGWVEFYKIMDMLKTKGYVHTGYKYSNKISTVSQLLNRYFFEIQKLFSVIDGK